MPELDWAPTPKPAAPTVQLDSRQGSIIGQIGALAKRPVAAIDRLAERGFGALAARTYDQHLSAEFRHAVRQGWTRPELPKNHPDIGKPDALLYKLHLAETEIKHSPTERLVAFSPSGQVIRYDLGGEFGVGNLGPGAVKGAVVTHNHPFADAHELENSRGLPDHNASLSRTDIAAIQRDGPAELRVVRGDWLSSWQAQPGVVPPSVEAFDATQRELRGQMIAVEVSQGMDTDQFAVAQAAVMQELSTRMGFTLTCLGDRGPQPSGGSLLTPTRSRQSDGSPAVGQETLRHTAGVWQASQFKAIRRAAREILSGQKPSGQGAEAMQMLTALHSAVPNAPALDRGLRMRGTAAELLERFSAGSEVDLLPQSFTANTRWVADKFAEVRPAELQTHTSVIFHLAPGSRSVDLAPFADTAKPVPYETEWVGGGRFRITEARLASRHVLDIEGRSARAQQLHVKIEQTGGIETVDANRAYPSADQQ